jgi:hypothetical protein
VQKVEADQEIVGFVYISCRKTLEERAFKLERPQLVGRDGAPIREPHHPVRESRCDGRFFTSGGDPDQAAGTQIDRHQRVGVGSQPQSVPRARKVDHERPTFDGGHASDA